MDNPTVGTTVPGSGWHNSGGQIRSSDTDTEREYRSTSRSDPSSHSRSYTRDSRGYERTRSSERTRSPDALSADTTPDPPPPVPYWSAKRHLTCGNPAAGPPWSSNQPPWRGSAPGKLKTANALLCICLNVDVDPPDVVRAYPCAVLECWVDPSTLPAKKAIEAVGSNLQHQFEGLSQKINYKAILDPPLDLLRRLCHTLRKQAKEDAVLFYYNGHGVPKPSSSGELWCFNHDFTQYIPISIGELQNWIGSPGVYIWDCSAAGNLLQNFLNIAKKKDDEVMARGGFPEGIQPFMNSLQLAACGANETLPTAPELPADVFTSCLTSPIDMALRFYILNHQLPNNINLDMIRQLPGDLKDRRTPLGELNWIFTAITDTIAWTTFTHDTFTRLYRCDLLIASLFRNFLLAERIMKNYSCTPHTYPPLPATNTHPLWATWDLVVDSCLRQLPELLEKAGVSSASSLTFGATVHLDPMNTAFTFATASGRNAQTTQSDPTSPPPPRLPDRPPGYVPSRFFADQLTAFEVWISRGGSALTKKGPMSLPLQQVTEEGKEPGTATEGTAAGKAEQPDGKANPEAAAPKPEPELQQAQVVNELDNYSERHLVPRKPPDQLPIVLQVLLSQPHRLRALILLSQFVDLGPWAVHLVLTIGIFPYISKLLQAAGQDLRPVLIFIWSRIMAVDSSVQFDLYNTQGYRYFSNILGLRNEDNLPNSSEHKAMCSFILASIARDFPHGQLACWNERVFDHCYDRLESPDFLLRQWTALCIGQMWDGNDEIKVYGVDGGTQDKLIAMLSDDSVEVRAAALFALGTFMGASGSSNPARRGGGGTGTMYQLNERDHFRMDVAVVTGTALAIKDDASPMCRKELLVVLSCLVKEYRGYFVVCAWIYWEEDRRWRSGSFTGRSHFNDEDITNQAVAEWLEGFGDDERLREESRVLLSTFFTIFVILLDLSADPYEEVATNAQTIVDYIMALLLESPFTRLESSASLRDTASGLDKKAGSHQGSVRGRVSSLQSSPSHNQPFSPVPGSSTQKSRPPMSRNDSVTSTLVDTVSSTLKRTSSFANALKVLTGSITMSHSNEDGRASPSFSISSRRQDASGPPTAASDISRPPSPNMNVAKYTSPYYAGGPSTEPFPGRGGPSRSEPSSPRHSHVNGYHHHQQQQQHEEEQERPADFMAWHVMEALIEEDMERLRARRKVGSNAMRAQQQHGHHHGGGGGLPSPSHSTFSMESGGTVILGLGTGAGIRDVLPLKSAYFDWCAEYFKEPQMRQAEADEPGSVAYNYQVWRQLRNDKVKKDTETQAPLADNGRWDRTIATINVPGHPLTMALHAFDDHLVIANESDMISVWDWKQRRRLNYFCNGNPKGTSITALEIINQEVGGIILTASADGIVRLFRNYDPTLEQGPIQMVSAFRGLNEIVQTRHGSGVVMDWKQNSGALLIGGDSRVIKVWDALTETQGLDLVTNSESPVTSIASDPGFSKTFLASFADGVVKVFDRRLDEEDCVVRTYSDHTSWVQNVRWHPTLSAQFLSASVDGEVKLFDLRGSDHASKQWTVHHNGLSSFDVHPIANVFATNSTISPVYWRSQRVVVHSITRQQPLSAFNVPTGLTAPPIRGLPSPFIPRLSSLVFHPTEMLYANGGPDGTVRIIGCGL
ncbi:hypothetical protein D9613_004298 [Agrocybe pediades]|uniref:Raptor N-terminal CASPase-like domain-containing protein n=1 Tax=Agrocybe pediades TaxID=84607 RepID=A0A8H4QK64_9AGAR|nr:hypothetical protein D9613_004298 [Agrocybe pediades]